MYATYGKWSHIQALQGIDGYVTCIIDELWMTRRSTGTWALSLTLINKLLWELSEVKVSLLAPFDLDLVSAKRKKQKNTKPENDRLTKLLILSGLRHSTPPTSELYHLTYSNERKWRRSKRFFFLFSLLSARTMACWTGWGGCKVLHILQARLWVKGAAFLINSTFLIRKR